MAQPVYTTTTSCAWRIRSVCVVSLTVHFVQHFNLYQSLMYMAFKSISLITNKVQHLDVLSSQKGELVKLFLFYTELLNFSSWFILILHIFLVWLYLYFLILFTLFYNIVEFTKFSSMGSVFCVFNKAFLTWKLWRLSEAVSNLMVSHIYSIVSEPFTESVLSSTICNTNSTAT